MGIAGDHGFRENVDSSKYDRREISYLSSIFFFAPSQYGRAFGIIKKSLIYYTINPYNTIPPFDTVITCAI